ncbi:MAG: cation:proton antiporter [Thiohalobacterales bacterium]|nr:cation:proton antiporter [Thiohalobacterales bacterium]
MHESIELQMSLLLAVALAGHLLAGLVRQPAVVGQILAGLIVGPSVFGWITYTSFVTNVAHLGAIVLLFVVGLEFRARELAAVRPFLVALAGVIVPWLAGYFVARGFGFETTRALLIGVALSATSIAITADTLRELGRLQSPESRLIIGAAVIDDVLALLALSLTDQIGSGDVELASIGIMAFKALAFIAIGAWLGQIVLARLSAKIDASRLAERSPEFVFVLGLLTAFAYALIAEHLGLSAIVGAFVAGIVFEGIHVSKSRSVHLGADYVRAAFGAVFFVSLGVLADLRTVGTGTLIFAGVLTLAAFFSKLVGCGLTARLTGIKTRESLIIGVGMSPRGEVAMVIALLALNRGIIEQPAYVAMVLMSLLTTLVVPILLRNWLYRTE